MCVVRAPQPALSASLPFITQQPEAQQIRIASVTLHRFASSDFQRKSIVLQKLDRGCVIFERYRGDLIQVQFIERVAHEHLKRFAAKAAMSIIRITDTDQHTADTVSPLDGEQTRKTDQPISLLGANR